MTHEGEKREALVAVTPKRHLIVVLLQSFQISEMETVCIVQVCQYL